MLKKVLLTLIVALIAGDALLLHGRYRMKVEEEAEIVDHKVREQNWSSTLVGSKRK
jgi:hypothetical protein